MSEQTNDAPTLRYDGAAERRALILRTVTARGFVSAGEISQSVGVSEMTIRRDFRRLAEAGQVRDVYGGVSAIQPRRPALFQERRSENLQRKLAIGRTAAARVPAHAAIALDSGSTVVELAGQLDPDLPLSVVTHSLPAINALSRRDGLNLVALGGVYDQALSVFIDPNVAHTLDHLRVDMVFLGTSAIDTDLYCGNLAEAGMKRALAEIAQQVVVLCDSSKFGPARSAMARMMSITEIDRIVTDDGISDTMRTQLEQAGCEVIVAPLQADTA